MDVMELLQALFRWIHVVAGILWIGLLYWFNWVNIPFVATLEGGDKQKIFPELYPRSLYWFRWGAAYTWITGVLLLLLVFYHGETLFDEGMDWGVPTLVGIAVTFLAVFLYDYLYKTFLKKNDIVATAISAVLIAGVLWLFEGWAGWGYRGYVIHTGALFGTIMAFNVWYRIWPAQQVIIPAIKAGEAPDPALAALAGMRSRHNTFLSVPLIWAMLDAHTATTGAGSRYILFAVIIVSWLIVDHLYKRSGKVGGM